MPGCFGFQISTRFDSIVFRPQNAGGFCRCKIQRGAGKTGGNAAREGGNAVCGGCKPPVTRATPFVARQIETALMP